MSDQHCLMCFMQNVFFSFLSPHWPERASMATRARSQATAATLADALAPLVKSLGRSFLDYNECVDVAESKLNVPKILRRWDILGAIMATGGLCISRSTCTKVLELIYAKLEHDPNVKMQAGHYTGWVTVMSRRLFNLTHDVHAQNQKAKRPVWLAQAPWVQSAAGVSAGGEPDTAAPPSSSKTDTTAAPASSTSPQYIYGWDRVLKMAWRIPSNSKSGGGKKQVCTDLWAPADGAEVIAIWADGDRWSVSGLTPAKLHAREAAKHPKVFWQGTHQVTHNALVIKHKRDRHAAGVVALMDQKTHIGTLQIHPWGETEDAAPEPMKHMQAIAEKYASGALSREEIKGACKEVIVKKQLENKENKTKAKHKEPQRETTQEPEQEQTHKEEPKQERDKEPDQEQVHNAPRKRPAAHERMTRKRAKQSECQHEQGDELGEVVPVVADVAADSSAADQQVVKK